MKRYLLLFIPLFVLASCAKEHFLIQKEDIGVDSKLVSSEVEIATAKKTIRAAGSNFSACSADPNAFYGQPWFTDFIRSFQTIKRDTEWDSRLDICFSKTLQKVIVNVPYTVTDKKDFLCGESEQSPCKDTLNIFLYNIANKTFTQAARDPKTIIYQSPKGTDPQKFLVARNQTVLHYWNPSWKSFQHADISDALISGFEKEQGNMVLLNSGYGDAGCWSESIWEYDYVSNIIGLKSKKSGCEN